ncbi:MAG TPA: hypothetical protein VFO89_08675, partial [Thermoanaerobaculia bacterium]|nr:hypothetical protein [Thermoanaerobaculia bacterium]
MSGERHVEWASPAALWDQFNGATSASQRRVFRTPAILRFATDDFMKDFIDVMQNDPRRITSMLAVPETWRKPAAEVEVPRVPGGVAGLLTRARTAAVRKLEARQGLVRGTAWNVADAQPLKFYQPAHERYYLVTASLICRIVGMPDRALDTTKQERATFVIRMLQMADESAINPDPAQCSELALVGNEWKPLADAATLAAGETQYPLSPFTYDEIDGRRRRVFNGLIPVAKREALVSAKMPDPGSSTSTLTPIDGRQMLLKSQVLGPWSQLGTVAILAQQQTATVDAAPDPNAVAATRKTANEQIQTISWYVLLDLDEWLEENIPEVHTAVKNTSAAGLSGAKLTAYQTLQNLSRGGKSFIAAMNAIRPSRRELELVTSPYVTGSADWPSYLFQFVT